VVEVNVIQRYTSPAAIAEHFILVCTIWIGQIISLPKSIALFHIQRSATNQFFDRQATSQSKETRVPSDKMTQISHWIDGIDNLHADHLKSDMGPQKLPKS